MRRFQHEVTKAPQARIFLFKNLVNLVSLCPCVENSFSPLEYELNEAILPVFTPVDWRNRFLLAIHNYGKDPD